MALPLEESTGTSTKDFLRVSNQVPPGGIAAWNAILSSNGRCCRSVINLWSTPWSGGSRNGIPCRDSSDLHTTRGGSDDDALSLMSLVREFNVAVDILLRISYVYPNLNP